MARDVPLHLRQLSVSQQILLMSVVLVSGNLASTTTKSSRVYLFQQARCSAYYQSHDSTQISPHNRVDESLCKLPDIQYPLSIVLGIDSCLSALPGKLWSISTPLFDNHLDCKPRYCSRADVVFPRRW